VAAAITLFASGPLVANRQVHAFPSGGAGGGGLSGGGGGS